VHPEFMNITIRDDEAVNEEDAWNWPRKVRARVGFDYFPKAEELTKWMRLEDLGFIQQIMSWSRVDYLMSQGDEKFREYFRGMKSMPIPRDGIGVLPEHVRAQQEKLLKEVYGLDAATFDERWKQFVLKTYPKK